MCSRVCLPGISTKPFQYMAWRCSCMCQSGPISYGYVCSTHGIFAATSRDSSSPPLPLRCRGWGCALGHFGLWRITDRTSHWGACPQYQQDMDLHLLSLDSYLLGMRFQDHGMKGELRLVHLRGHSPTTSIMDQNCTQQDYGAPLMTTAIIHAG